MKQNRMFSLSNRNTNQNNSLYTCWKFTVSSYNLRLSIILPCLPTLGSYTVTCSQMSSCHSYLITVVHAMNMAYKSTQLSALSDLPKYTQILANPLLIAELLPPFLSQTEPKAKQYECQTLCSCRIKKCKEGKRKTRQTPCYFSIQESEKIKIIMHSSTIKQKGAYHHLLPFLYYV